ncbi:hypothetical protein JCM3770_002615 [Rhodotorula araucariae]
MESLQCNGFTAVLTLSTTRLRPLSTLVSAQSPHAVEGIYSAPLVAGQVWTLAWTGTRPGTGPVHATVLVQEGEGEPTAHAVDGGAPSILRGIIQTAVPPLKLTLVLTAPGPIANLAVFVLVCGDSSPRALTSARLLDDVLGPTHIPHEDHWPSQSPQDPSEHTVEVFGSPTSRVLDGADDSGIGLDAVELEKVQREHRFYRTAAERLERAMSHASHIRYLSLCLSNDGVDDIVAAGEEAIAPTTRVQWAVAREQTRELLRAEADMRVRWELQGVLRMLVGREQARGR